MFASRTVRWVALAVVVVGCAIVVRAWAEEGEKKPAKDEPLVLRMYDVKDLVIDRKDQPWQGTNLPVIEDSNRVITRLPEPPIAIDRWECLVPILQRTVSSQSDPGVAAWSDEGGPAAIEYLAPILIITQTPAAHKQIEDLLGQYRKHLQSTPIVTILARWVQVDADKAAKFLAGRAGADGQAVSAAALEEAGAKTLYQGHVQGYDCQLVHMESGEHRTYILSVEPVISAGAVACKPSVRDAMFGAVLEVRPILSPDAQWATLDLRSFVMEFKEMRTKSLPDFGQAQGSAQPIRMNLDLPSFFVHTFASTAKVPLGKPVLIGSMTQPGDKVGKVLFLILEVSATK
jgi:hypothetical protein